MKALSFGALALLAGCAGPGMIASGGGNAAGPGGAFREVMVIGSTMSFEDCRARGGLIIHDAGSPMTACDPSVRHNPAPRTAIDDPLTNTDLNAALEQRDMDAGV